MRALISSNMQKDNPIEITIDKHSTTPIYMQIVFHIHSCIQQGQIKGGYKLPTVRELADKTGLSIGTVRRAYDELQRMNMIEMTQGKGTFILTKAEDVTIVSKKERAMAAIDTLIDELLELKFSYREIEILMELNILNRQEKSDKVTIAIVDCNPESISVIAKQLSDLNNITIVEFLLDNVQLSPFKLVGNYDIIVTTNTHYELLSDILYQKIENITKVVMTTSDRTILDLASIPEGSNVGIWCQSTRFVRIVNQGLAKYTKNLNNITHALQSEKCDFKKFLDSINVLIVSPDYLSFTPKENITLIDKFSSKGGKVVHYNYQTDRGSLMFLRERIESLEKTFKKEA